VKPFFEIATYIPLVPAVLALVRWKSLNLGQRWFGILLWIIAICSIAASILATVWQVNNMPIFHSYILIEFLLLLVVFSSLLETPFRSKLWLSMAATFALLWILNIAFGDGWLGYPTYIHVFEGLVLMGLALRWFAKILSEKRVQRPVQTFAFWMCTGILIYFSGNLLLFMFSNFIVEQSKAVFTAIWGVHAILVILLYLTYSVAILWAKNNPISS
jgi:hypothetical protein